MYIFNNPVGTRCHITTGTVNLEIPSAGAKGMIRTDVSYWATATDRYQIYNGVKRRLFVDMSEDFGLGREIWLTDGPAVVINIEEWSEIIGE